MSTATPTLSSFKALYEDGENLKGDSTLVKLAAKVPRIEQ
jgi:hypothetical protein